MTTAIKTPEQLEDAGVTDVLNTVIGLAQKREKRQVMNYLRARLEPEIVSARLNGRAIDLDKFTIRAAALVREFYERN